MTILLIVLILTNLLTVALVVWLLRRPSINPGEPDAVAETLERTPTPAASPGGTRRLISVEILNPIELAATRGRLIGLMGSLAPGLTRRAVYDQTMKIMKQQLVDQQVVADVRLHTVRLPHGRSRAAEASTRPAAAADPRIVEHEPVPRQGRTRPPSRSPGTPRATTTRRPGEPASPGSGTTAGSATEPSTGAPASGTDSGRPTGPTG